MVKLQTGCRKKCGGACADRHSHIPAPLSPSPSRAARVPPLPIIRWGRGQRLRMDARQMNHPHNSPGPTTAPLGWSQSLLPNETYGPRRRILSSMLMSGTRFSGPQTTAAAGQPSRSPVRLLTATHPKPRHPVVHRIGKKHHDAKSETWHTGERAARHRKRPVLLARLFRNHLKPDILRLRENSRHQEERPTMASSLS